MGLRFVSNNLGAVKKTITALLNKSTLASETLPKACLINSIRKINFPSARVKRKTSPTVEVLSGR
jgi:hypothetical protein